jgi:hypothetical protein
MTGNAEEVVYVVSARGEDHEFGYETWRPFENTVYATRELAQPVADRLNEPWPRRHFRVDEWTLVRPRTPSDGVAVPLDPPCRLLGGRWCIEPAHWVTRVEHTVNGVPCHPGETP